MHIIDTYMFYWCLVFHCMRYSLAGLHISSFNFILCIVYICKYILFRALHYSKKHLNFRKYHIMRYYIHDLVFIPIFFIRSFSVLNLFCKRVGLKYHLHQLVFFHLLSNLKNMYKILFMLKEHLANKKIK